jgi:hypothetical protein
VAREKSCPPHFFPRVGSSGTSIARPSPPSETIEATSNDTGFVEQAIDAGVKAQKVAFPPNVPGETTVQWETLCDLLYIFAVVFGVVILPNVTLYGVWNGKDGSHWKGQELVLDVRSPKLETRLERDRKIVTRYTSR